jgi:hypothetical protein
MTWNFIDPNGQEHVLEKESAAEADAYAQEWFASYTREHTSPRNGQQFTDIGWLVEVDADGEEIRRIEHGLYYQHYHGNAKEHGTW